MDTIQRAKLRFSIQATRESVLCLISQVINRILTNLEMIIWSKYVPDGNGGTTETMCGNLLCGNRNNFCYKWVDTLGQFVKDSVLCSHWTRSINVFL